MPPKIVFEDDSILVLDKPAGLVVDKSETQQEGTLENWLESRHPVPDTGSINIERQGIVHRLDKDTSGLIIVAKTQNALENLQAQFAARETKKEYLALVHGFIEKSGIIEGAIGRNPKNRQKFTVLEGGKEAVTEYTPEKSLKFNDDNFEAVFDNLNKIQARKLERQGYNQFTLVRCFPHTGRTHQIRVHLKLLGHPIVADEKYAGRKIYRIDKRWCPRQFLHATKLGFTHPITGNWIEFESKLTNDLEKALWTISSYNSQ